MSIGGSFWRGGGSGREQFMVSGEVRVGTVGPGVGAGGEAVI